MTNRDRIADAARRFVEADKKHAVARAKAESLQGTLNRLEANRAAFRAARHSAV